MGRQCEAGGKMTKYGQSALNDVEDVSGWKTDETG